MRADKIRILNEAGYAYKFDRGIYFNPMRKKIFSIEFVEDHDEHELERLIGEDRRENSWEFYFNTPPSGAVKAELERALG